MFFFSYSRAHAHGKAQGHNCICGLHNSILPNLCQRAASFVMVQLVRADRTWYPPICMCRLRTTQSMHGLCHAAHVMTLLTCMQLLHVGPIICPHDSTHASATFLHTLLWRCPSTLAPLRAIVCHDKHPPLLSEAVQTRNTASIATWICTLAQTFVRHAATALAHWIPFVGCASLAALTWSRVVMILHALCYFGRCGRNSVMNSMSVVVASRGCDMGLSTACTYVCRHVCRPVCRHVCRHVCRRVLGCD